MKNFGTIIIQVTFQIILPLHKTLFAHSTDLRSFGMMKLPKKRRFSL